MSIKKAVDEQLKRIEKDMIWLGVETGYGRAKAYEIVGKNGEATINELRPIAKAFHMTMNHLLLECDK